MKKTVGFLCTILCIILTFTNAFAISFDFLDDLTLDELTALKSAVQAKILAKTASTVAPSTNLGMWVVQYYVDEFNQYTDIGYITHADIEGTFSNSAVDDRELLIRWLIDEDDVALKLFEYGDNLVKGTSSRSTTYSVTMRGNSGSDIKLSATLYADGDRLYFSDSDGKKIREEFSKNGKVSFYIVNNRYKTETYLFTMNNTSYFSNAWNKLIAQSAANKTLRQGDSGTDVLRMKTRMQELGYFSATSTLNDQYTSTTVERVKLFQKTNGLPQTGIADSTTLTLLYSNNAKRNPD